MAAKALISIWQHMRADAGGVHTGKSRALLVTLKGGGALTVSDRRSSCRGRSKDTRFPFFSDPFKQYLYPAFLFCGGRQRLGCPWDPWAKRHCGLITHAMGGANAVKNFPTRRLWRSGGDAATVVGELGEPSSPPSQPARRGLLGLWGRGASSTGWASAMRRTGRASSSGEGEKKGVPATRVYPTPHLSPCGTSGASAAVTSSISFSSLLLFSARGLDAAILDTASHRGALPTQTARLRGISAQWNVPDAIVRRR